MWWNQATTSPTMQLDPGSESREPCLATLLWRSRGTLSCTSWPWTTMDLRRVTHRPLLNWRMTWSLLPWWVAGPQGGPEFSGFEPWVGWDQIKSDQLELVNDVRNRPHLITNIWLVVWNIFLFFHILGIIITTDFHIFQRGWNHQPDIFSGFFKGMYLAEPRDAESHLDRSKVSSHWWSFLPRKMTVSCCKGYQALGSLLPHVAPKFRRQITQYCIGTNVISGTVRVLLDMTSLKITTCRLAC